MLSWSSRDRVAIVCGAEIAADDVAAERQRQPAGAVRPPLAEIDDLLQALFGVRHLSFVDQQARRELAGVHPLLNLVERHDDVLDRRVEQPQRQKCRRQFARAPRPARPSSDDGPSCLRDDHRAVAVAHARAVRQQHVAIGQMRVGVERDRRDLVLAVECGAVERLDVRQHVFELEPWRGDPAARQAVEHERVIGIGAVSDADLHAQGRLGARSAQVLGAAR